ncbi:MAG: hypothetical protein RIC14_13640 [Filomicrobium sp.]
MKRFAKTPHAVAAVALTIITLTLSAPTSMGKDADQELAETLVRDGRIEDSILACSLCHSEGGQGDVNFGFGNLTGQSEAYFTKQLKAFQTGEREHRVMQRVVKNLTERDIRALAKYYAGLSVAATEFEVYKVPPVGLKLATEGDEARGLPACDSCHAAEAADGELAIANINGQHSTYLINQLVAWQMGQRDKDSVMADIAPKLSISEINAVAIYYATRKRTGGK